MSQKNKEDFINVMTAESVKLSPEGQIMLIKLMDVMENTHGRGEKFVKDMGEVLAVMTKGVKILEEDFLPKRMDN